VNVRRCLSACTMLVVLAGAAHAASAPSPSDTLRRQAFDLVYNLDYERAVALAHQAVASDPGDAHNHLTLASVVWLKMLAARGATTIEEYLGPPPRGDVQRTPPPSDLAVTLKSALNAAIAIAERRLARQPNDTDAHYVLGAAVGRQAAYTASEEGRIAASVGAARRAYFAHRRVLELDARRKDAGLVVGTYRYVVATLSFFKRWFAYMAGFAGDKAVAIRMLSECAAYPSDVQTEARFGLLIIYSREERPDDALRVLQELRALYPRNRLLWIETGATHLRAGRPAEALRWLDNGLAMLAADTRPRTFGEDAMWRYKRASALVALGRGADARPDAEAATTLPSQTWVRGRAFVQLGRVEDLAGNRVAALRAYRRGAEMARAAGDPWGLEDAERGLDKPFGGTSGASSRQYR